MRMQVTFVDVTPNEAAQLLALVAVLAPEAQQVADAVAETEKPKRTRRTKAAMAEARAAAERGAEGSPAPAEGEGEPAPRRRKRRPAEEAVEGNLRRGRARREGAADPTTASASPTRSPSDEDEISDAEVARVASEGAQHLTPKVVTAVLEEFGVGFVNDLDQGQRREFVDDIELRISAFPEQREAPATEPKRRRRKR